MGIEIGKLFYWNREVPRNGNGAITANWDKLRVNVTLIGTFLVGAMAGALGFSLAGFISTVPLAIALAAISLAPTLSRPRS